MSYFNLYIRSREVSCPISSHQKKKVDFVSLLQDLLVLYRVLRGSSSANCRLACHQLGRCRTLTTRSYE